jgi:hypothetical protein
MGLLDRTKRVYIDGPDSDWVDMRPLSLGELRSFRHKAASVETVPGEEEAESQGYELSRLVLGACITAWSDEAKITPTNIERLPYEFTFKLTQAAGLGGKKGDDEEVPLPTGSDSSASSPVSPVPSSPPNG